MLKNQDYLNLGAIGVLAFYSTFLEFLFWFMLQESSYTKIIFIFKLIFETSSIFNPFTVSSLTFFLRWPSIILI